MSRYVHARALEPPPPPPRPPRPRAAQQREICTLTPHGLAEDPGRKAHSHKGRPGGKKNQQTRQGK